MVCTFFLDIIWVLTPPVRPEQADPSFRNGIFLRASLWRDAFRPMKATVEACGFTSLRHHVVLAQWCWPLPLLNKTKATSRVADRSSSCEGELAPDEGDEESISSSFSYQSSPRAKLRLCLGVLPNTTDHSGSGSTSTRRSAHVRLPRKAFKLDGSLTFRVAQDFKYAALLA
ncbi:hypothetical protein R3P38DRAFT_1631692 [Favolaschia claudopus]|uniref:Uncharacterized protein n=1 Tax=Favolaschia claudopus TaxID=2862362 RepID=A0AAW0DKW0_9AGAR